MTWTVEHRRAADRRGLRYPSDLTDDEWALVAPLIRPAKHGGRPPKVDVREVLNAVFYVLSTGCQWPALPKDLLPVPRRRSSRPSHPARARVLA
jgi:transposase